MLGDWINVINFNLNPQVLKKKLLKPLKITIFRPDLHKNGIPMGHMQSKKHKPDH